MCTYHTYFIDTNISVKIPQGISHKKIAIQICHFLIVPYDIRMEIFIIFVYNRNLERLLEETRMEQILSGYCRTIDASRMVLVEDGEADCDYECCAYRDVCQIGQEIARLCASEEAP